MGRGCFSFHYCNTAVVHVYTDLWLNTYSSRVLHDMYEVFIIDIDDCIIFLLMPTMKVVAALSTSSAGCAETGKHI